MKKYVGCDLGGTNLKAAVVDPLTGELSGVTSVPTLAREGHEAVLARMAQLIDTVIAASGVDRSEIGGVGIGAPGTMDMERGMSLFMPNLIGNWIEVPITGVISNAVHLPTFLINDVRAMTVGEWKLGAGRGIDTVACLALGTGIGGGLIIGGKLHLGIGGSAGELGHQTINFDGPPCGCGNHGCLETYASGPAITAVGLKYITQGQATRIATLVDYDLNKVNPKVIAQAAKEGDPIAIDIYERAGYYLGIAVANILVAVSPQRVVIGGGVAEAGDLLLEPVRRTVKERVFVVPVDQIDIVPAALGVNAGIIGAGLWAQIQTQA
ncbi:MAG: ROK family protein [Chloroflexi bacterium]|nr:ROK family protein [Anaerolineaceae bacterium]NMB87606.1 ROK family protein [Chloroflexota bacterium]